MLEWYQGFISANTLLFLALPGFPGELGCVTRAVEITGHVQM